ncbi:MAG: hypothetical protein ACUVSM_12580 [Armatimonadota bacterium]
MSVVCQWCGMESDDEHQCSWCRRMIVPPPAPPLPSSQSAADDEDQAAPAFIAPLPERLEWFASVVLPLMALGVAWTRWTAVPLPVTAACASLAACFFLSVYQLVQSVDERLAPVGLSAPLALMFGPVSAAVVFVAIFLVTGRRDALTPFGLLAVHSGAVLLMAYARAPEAGEALRRAGLFTGADAMSLAYLAGIAGWALANFWRPLNE